MDLYGANDKEILVKRPELEVAGGEAAKGEENLEGNETMK